MTRDEAVANIQTKLAFHTGLTSTIETALKNAQVQLEAGEELPYFLKSEYATIDTIADDERVVVPTDFLRELEDDEWMYYIDQSGTEDVWKPLDKVPPLEGRWRYPGEGEPKLFSLDNNYFRLYPTPDAVYRLTMQYYKKDDVLNSDIENLWLKHRPFLMIGLAGMHVTMGTRDNTAFQNFSALYQSEYTAMSNEETAREEANTTRQRGGAD